MSILDDQLAISAIKVTESGALEGYKLLGLGSENAVDKFAVAAMRNELNNLEIEGTIVIGEGERDQAPMLYIGEKVGTGRGAKFDIAVDPVEGTTILSEARNNSLSVLAMSEDQGILNAPDVYMEKIAIGFNFPEPLIDLDNTVKENLHNVARAKNISINDMLVSVLNRDRHKDLISQIRAVGARVQLIQDGDIAAIVGLALGSSNADIYMGIGGAPEGVLAASALQTLGGQVCCRLILDSEDKISRSKRMGIEDINKKYYIDDLIKKDSIFVATGITNGILLDGIKKDKKSIILSSMVTNSSNKKIKWLKSQYIL